MSQWIRLHRKLPKGKMKRKSVENAEDTLRDTEKIVRRYNSCVTGIPEAEEKENGSEAIFENTVI